MPGSTLFKAFVLFIALWAPVTQADSGWQPVQETIRKSDKDTRQYQAIRLDNGMTVLLVSDPQAVKSLSALVVPVGSLEDPDAHPGLAHYLEHMTLMGSKKYPQPDSLSEFLKMHGGSHNASTAPYRTAFYLEVENDALDGAVDRLADAIAAPLLDKKYADRERNAVNAELTMARTRDGMRMAQVSAETINPAHPGSRFSGGNLETLSDKPGSPVLDALHAFSTAINRCRRWQTWPRRPTAGCQIKISICRRLTCRLSRTRKKALLFTMCQPCRARCYALNSVLITTRRSSAAKPTSW